MNKKRGTKKMALRGKITELFKHNRASKIAGIVVALLLVAAGLIVLQLNAAGFFAAADPESATVSGNAKVVDDTTALGGKAIEFTAPVTTPPPPPPPPPPPSGTAKPDASNTGVPAGTVLTDYTGSEENHDSNKTFDGVRFNGNDHRFYGDNLVFKNCQFKNSGVLFENNTTVRIEHCDLNGDLSINNSQNVTILYNNIHNWGDALHVTTEIGFPVIKNMTVSYNYMHSPGPLSCGAHSDVVQLIGVDGFTATYNNMDMGKQFNNCGDLWPLNGAFQIKTDFTGVLNKNLTIDHNWLNGGGYTVRLYECGGTTKVTNNRFGRDHTWGPFDYPRPANCPIADKSGNVYDDNNASISF